MKMNNVNTNKIDANKLLLRVILAAAAVLILCGTLCGAAGAASGSSLNENTSPLLSDEYEAVIDDTYYLTLDEALSAADGKTVTLLKNIGSDTAGRHISIPEGKTITINLNGYTVNGGSSGEDAGKAAVTNYGTLTLTSEQPAEYATVKRADTHNPTDGTPSSADWHSVIDNFGTLTLKNVNIQNNTDASVSGNGGVPLICNGDNEKPGVLYIESGMLVQNKSCAVRNAKDSAVTIYGGSFLSGEAPYAILNQGRINMYGGSIEGPIGITGDAGACGSMSVFGGNFRKSVLGISDSPDSLNRPGISLIALEGCTGPLSANIYDGRFLEENYGFAEGRGTIEQGVVTLDSSVGTIEIRGGYFRFDPKDHLADNYFWNPVSRWVGEGKTANVSGGETCPDFAPAWGTNLEKITGLPSRAVSAVVMESGCDTNVLSEELLLTAMFDVILYDADRNLITDKTEQNRQLIIVQELNNHSADSFEIYSGEPDENGVIKSWYPADIIRREVSKDKSLVTITAESGECSTFAVVIIPDPDPTPAPKSSSTSQGTSTWLTAEPTPTATPTPTPTVTPTPEVPQVKPVETKQAETPVPFMGILAGLGCAAVVFGLRRK